MGGCQSCQSSPHNKRIYRNITVKDPADLDEVIVHDDEPIKYFGMYRNNSNIVPNDVEGALVNTHMVENLVSNPNELLYEAEMDHGRSWRGCRPIWLIFLFPLTWIWLLAKGLQKCFEVFTCDQACMYVRKEYMTRQFFRIYSNRIEYHDPKFRLFGCFGCGSWNADEIQTNYFDRGAFGFRRVNTCCLINGLCCIWPIYGQVMARQRCQCNGSLWNTICTNCCGCWCDEWICDKMFCTFRYYGLANADEVSFVSSIVLQSYFEGRKITKNDVDKCIKYWKDNISEQHNPIKLKRDVCCEPYCSIPFYQCSYCYEHITHTKRYNPYKYGDDENDEENGYYNTTGKCTKEIDDAYKKHDEERINQINMYKSYRGPKSMGTVCKCLGCKRFFGRNGFCFCTEGICNGPCTYNNCTSKTPSSLEGEEDNDNNKKQQPVAPPFAQYDDIDDNNDASIILMKVLGPPPKNVIYKRYVYDEKSKQTILIELPKQFEQYYDNDNGNEDWNNDDNNNAGDDDDNNEQQQEEGVLEEEGDGNNSPEDDEGETTTSPLLLVPDGNNETVGDNETNNNSNDNDTDQPTSTSSSTYQSIFSFMGGGGNSGSNNNDDKNK